MPRLRIGLAQINCTVGDLDGNVAKINDYCHRAAEKEVDLLAFPEMCVSGYPPEDLLLKSQFVIDCRSKLEEIAIFSRDFPDMTVLVGGVDCEKDIRNGAAIINDGRLLDVYHKIYLPNYGVFDEQRYFKAGDQGVVIKLGGIGVGISICEDMWYPEGPPHIEAAAGGAELVININASPYHLEKGGFRLQMLADRALENLCAMAYVNMVGGQDELVFDGQSMIFDHLGKKVASGRRFKEDLVLADIDTDPIIAARRESSSWRQVQEEAEKHGLSIRELTITDKLLKAKTTSLVQDDPKEMGRLEQVFEALTLGVRDYVRKNGFSRIVVGLSGGIDSALTAAVGVAALGAANVTAVFMPSRFTSQASVEDAKAVADNLAIDLVEVEIDSTFNTLLIALKPAFKGKAVDITEENLQARIRGNVLMAFSNKFNWLLLSTGNKSEMSVGYATLYGDMSGGFAVLKDVPKTLVYELARYFNELSGGQPIPERVFSKPPTAELRADQKDSDLLPEYDLLDPIIQAYVEEDCSVAEIVREGFDPEVVVKVTKMIDKSEYKRRQAPPGVKITSRAFGKDWRLPITNWYKKNNSGTVT